MAQDQSKKYPTILIIHFHSTKNAGDAAQLEAAIEGLRYQFEEARILVASNYPNEKVLNYLGVDAIPSISSLIGVGSGKDGSKIAFNFLKALLLILIAFLTRNRLPKSQDSLRGWSALFNTYRSADIVVSTPGNIFFTMGRIGFPFLSSSLAIIPTMIFHKPLYIMPQSIGPLHRWWERRILRWLYSHASLIFLREPISFRLADEIKLPMDRVHLSVDQALEFREPSRKQVPLYLQKVGFNAAGRAIGVTVIQRMVKSLPVSTFNPYYQTLADSLSSFADQYAMDVYFFPQVTGPTPHEDDREAIRNVASRMTCSRDQIKILESHFNQDEQRELYQWMDIFIASRLHSGIFALSYGIPTLLINYLTKSQGFMEALDLQEWVLDLASIDQQKLNDKLEALWNGRLQIRAQIRQRVRAAVMRSPNPAEEIAKDFLYGRG